MFISDKADFKTRTVVKDQKGHKRVNQKRRYGILYVPNIGTPQYIKQVLINRPKGRI